MTTPKRLSRLTRVTALALTALVAATLAGPAEARASGPPRGDATRAAATLPGYVVVHGPVVTAAAHAQTFGSAICPLGAVPLGGGVAGVGNASGSFPLGNGWGAEVGNPTATASTFVVSAICATKPAKYALVYSATIAVASGARVDSITATCASGKPLGGGLVVADSLSALVAINSSTPQGKTWRANAVNGSSAAEHVRSVAVCGKVAKYHVVTGAKVDQAPGSSLGGAAACGTGVPLGGGVLSSSLSPQVVISSTYPIAGGWENFMINGSTTTNTFQAKVVCSG